MKPKKYTVAILSLFLWGCPGEKEAHRQPAEPSVAPGTPVETNRLSPVPDFFEAVGTVAPTRSATLSSKTVGTVTVVHVREGDKVRKGQALVEIDRRDLQAQLDEAQASMEEAKWAIGAAESALAGAKGRKELAQATLKRYEPLVGRGSVTPQEHDEVRAKYAVASAEVDRAERNLRALRAKREQARARISHIQTILSYTTVTSPYDGVVTAKMVETGMLASPGVALLSVEETGRYRLEAQVAESQIRHVLVGRTASVRIDAINGDLSGTVVEVVPAAEPQSRTFTVKISLPSHPGIRSGLFGRARFPLGERKILAVPLTALVHRGQLIGLYVVGQGGAAQLRLVKTGRQYGDRIEVLSGLKEGGRVVTVGTERLTEGSRLAE